MALFSFSKPESSNSSQNIQLIINDEVVDVPAAEAAGMTISQVFQRFASSVCDTSRINRYVSLGRIVDGSTPIEAGTVYSGSIASESKG